MASDQAFDRNTSAADSLATKPVKGPMLAEYLADRINNEGKITFHEWMSAALYHPNGGYYNRSDLTRWGREGDYRTSPERSELFASAFARYFFSLHERMGLPPELSIVEVGAGGGQFAAGVLEKLKNSFLRVYQSTRYQIVDVSEDARRQTLEQLRAHANAEVVDLDDLQPQASVIVFSNELLDAFPVHRVTKIDGQFKEFYVTQSSDGKFKWVVDDLSGDALSDLCVRALPDLADGQIAEVNPGIEDWFHKLDQKVESGFIITVDYGAESTDLYDLNQRKHGSLRAYRRHRFVDDVLESPGDCDVTSSVNWTFVKNVGRQFGFEVEEFLQLDKFLIQVGVLHELEERLATCDSEAERSSLTAAAREMILPGGMASSFQVLIQKAITNDGFKLHSD